MTPSANRPCWGLCALGSAPGSSRNFLDVSGEATHCLVSSSLLAEWRKIGNYYFLLIICSAEVCHRLGVAFGVFACCAVDPGAAVHDGGDNSSCEVLVQKEEDCIQLCSP